MKTIKKIILVLFLLQSVALSETISKVEIQGNKRISKDTIILFGNIKLNESYDEFKLNKILKNLYETNFFNTVDIIIDKNTLIVNVDENPIIQSVIINGIKNKRIIKSLQDNLILKEKNSFIISKAKNDENILKQILKANGYYFSNIETVIVNNDNNTVNINYNIELGEKAFISNIKFIGDKKIKDRKLKNVIISEESKFWKFISNKKFLDENRIKLDENLLRNYYRNNGYYNAKINSTSAQILKSNKFELIFNIDAGEKFIFGEMQVNLPNYFDPNSFKDITKTLEKLKNKNYSLNRIEKILDEIDKIVLDKQFEFVNATFNEVIVGNKINLKINLVEKEKKYIEKINILGNYITNEEVIRNALIADEGDPFNEILFKKSVDNIKSKRIFSSVDTKVSDGANDQSKIIDIIVDEKPTGEISAGAGTGTSGSTVSFSVLENNYLGKGTKLKASLSLSDNSVEALFSINEPNFKNSDKALITTIENSSDDQMSKFGYETKKTGFSFGTSFEQYKDIFFTPSISTYFESLETSSKASATKKKQEGDYFDTNFTYSLTLNKLNQNFQPSDGFKSSFYQSLPLLADDQSILNSYEYSAYTKLVNDSVLSLVFMARSVNSIDDDDVRISNRIFIPSRKLRGFVSGKIGPKDGSDYIGGNYGSAINAAATLPNLFADLQNVDFSLFFDSANLFGVDYNSSLDSSKIRTATGVAVDWFTPIGPLSFSLAAPLTKASTDATETFRFKLGTTF